MRMVVAQDVAEDREFVDNFDVIAQQCAVSQHPAAAPPPPALVDMPKIRHPRVGGKIAHGEETGQPVDVYALSIEPFQNPLQIARNADGDRGQKTAGRCGPSAACGLPPAACGCGGHQQIVSHAKAAQQQQSKPAGLAQIVSDLWHLSGQVGECDQQPVAEIVVADGVARQPGVSGRKGGAGPDAIHKHQVHRLFGVVDTRIVGADQRPQREGDEEEHLHTQQVAPAASEGQASSLPQSCDLFPARRDAQHRHQPQSQPGAAPFVAQNAVARPQPQNHAHQQNAQTFGKGIAPIRQVGKETQSQGQRHNGNQLYDQIPDQKIKNNCAHTISA